MSVGTRPRRRAGARRGFTLVEMTVGAVMVAAALALAVQLLGWRAAERVANGRREAARRAVANAVERLAARPWDDLTPEAAGRFELPSAVREILPGAALRAEVGPGPDPDSKRILVELRWRDRSGAMAAPVRLVAFRYRLGEGRP